MKSYLYISETLMGSIVCAKHLLEEKICSLHSHHFTRGSDTTRHTRDSEYSKNVAYCSLLNQ